jgi:hypothetical protein
MYRLFFHALKTYRRSRCIAPLILNLTIEIQRMWTVKTKVIPAVIVGNWNRLKIPGQRTGKARYQRTAENSCTGHSTHTAGSVNVESQNVQQGK